MGKIFNIFDKFPQEPFEVPTKALFAKAKKHDVDLSDDIIAMARERNMNLDNHIERCIFRKERTETMREWCKENADAIAESNEFARKYGLLSDWMWRDERSGDSHSAA